MPQRVESLLHAGRNASDAAPDDQAFVTLTQLARWAPASRRTPEAWVRLEENPMPAHQRPGDGAWVVQWGQFKEWFYERSAGDDVDPATQETARSMLVGIAGVT